MTNLLRILLVFLLAFSLQTSFAQSERFTIRAEQMLLVDLLEQIEQKEGYLFSYQVQDVEGIRVSVDLKKTDIHFFCKYLSEVTGLEFNPLSPPYVIVQNLRGEQKNSSTRMLSGTVIDHLTQVPLAYATVYLQASMIGEYSDHKGRFQLEIGADVQDTLVVSYVGYEVQKIPILANEQYEPFGVGLAYFSFGENMVVVTDYLTDGIDLAEEGASTNLGPARLGTFPGQVEPDILQSIQFLPGVSSPDGSAESIYIRGSTPDHNLLRWEEIPIYHSTHLFGMVSAFNPYIMEEVEVHRGGFGAEDGGRIAGLIDLYSPDQTVEQNQWGAGGTTTHGQTYGAFSLGQKKAVGLVYSLRHSLAGLWTSPIQQQSVFRDQVGPIFGDMDPFDLPAEVTLEEELQFSDGNLKLSWAPNERHQFELAGFFSQNTYTDRIVAILRGAEHLNDLTQGNRGAKMSWTSAWNERWSSEVTTLGTHFDYQYTFDQRPIDTSEMEPRWSSERINAVTEWQAKSAVQYAGKGGAEWKLGYQLTQYEVDFFVRSQRNSMMPNSNGDDKSATNHSLFTNFQTNPDARLGFELGFRLNRFHPADRLFGEPRMRFWMHPSENWVLHVQSGQYFQFISQVVEFVGEEVGLIAPMWRLNFGQNNPALRSWQHQFGLTYHQNGWVLDLQGYIKRSKGISLMALGYTPPAGNNFFIGNSEAEGIDLLIKKRIQNYRMWVSYSLGRSAYVFKNFFDQQFPSPYDIRHQFNWVHLWKIGAWELSASWKWQSGLPYSEAVDLVQMMSDNGPPTYRLIYDELNEQRLPTQHQMDVSAVYHFHPQSRKNWQGWLGFSLINLYNRRNVYQRDYFHWGWAGEPREIFYVEKEQLGITPNAVLRLQF